MHAGLLAGLALAPGSGAPVPAALSVRLEATSTPEPEAPFSPSASQSDAVPRPQPRLSPSRPPPVSVLARADESAAATVMPPSITDPTYYAAGDLDAYPRLVVPLRFDPLEPRGAAREAARIVLQLLIDEHGTVREATVIEAVPRELGEMARAELVSARFLPAMKNDRPVRSRVTLRIEPGAAPRE